MTHRGDSRRFGFSAEEFNARRGLPDPDGYLHDLLTRCDMRCSNQECLMFEAKLARQASAHFCHGWRQQLRGSVRDLIPTRPLGSGLSHVPSIDKSPQQSSVLLSLPKNDTLVLSRVCDKQVTTVVANASPGTRQLPVARECCSILLSE